MAKTQQEQIVSQSTLKLILEWSNTCGYCLELKDLCAVSVVVEDYIQNGYSKELGNRLEKIDEYLKGKELGKGLV